MPTLFVRFISEQIWITEGKAAERQKWNGAEEYFVKQRIGWFEKRTRQVETCYIHHGKLSVCENRVKNRFYILCPIFCHESKNTLCLLTIRGSCRLSRGIKCNTARNLGLSFRVVDWRQMTVSEFVNAMNSVIEIVRHFVNSNSILFMQLLAQRLIKSIRLALFFATMRKPYQRN